MVSLTEHQKECMDEIISAGRAGKKVLSLIGPAGTGKTTMISKIGIEAVREGPWDNVIYWTSTGRAMVVLASKIMADVSTFHSGLYGRGIEEKTPMMVDGKPVLNEDGTPVMARTGRLFFGKPKTNFCTPGTLIVVDEASMITMKMHEDLMSVLPPGCSVLYVGDKEQLPPVVGSPVPGFREDDEPTAELKEIHRQAWDNPVIRLATDIRKGLSYRVDNTDDRILDFPYNEHEAALWRADMFKEGRDAMLITDTNRVRRRVNDKIRSFLDRKDIIEEGEILCCFRNDHMRGIMNGETFRVSKVIEAELPYFGWLLIILKEGDSRPILVQQGTIGATGDRWSAFVDSLYASFSGKNMNGINFMEEIRKCLISNKWAESSARIPATMSTYRSNEWVRNAFLHVDYGYCLTIHKAQGSEWDEVGVLMSRWGKNVLGYRGEYTAVTRTKNRLIRWSVDRS